MEVCEINNEDVDALMKNLQVKSSPVVNDRLLGNKTIRLSTFAFPVG